MRNIELLCSCFYSRNHSRMWLVVFKVEIIVVYAWDEVISKTCLTILLFSLKTRYLKSRYPNIVRTKYHNIIDIKILNIILQLYCEVSYCYEIILPTKKNDSQSQNLSIIKLFIFIICSNLHFYKI